MSSIFCNDTLTYGIELSNCFMGNIDRTFTLKK